jgi:transposase InsO family protein
MEQMSWTGACYFVTFIDDFTKKTFVYFLKTKDEVFEKFMSFKTLVEKQRGNNIKILRTGNGGEYTSKAFTVYLRKEGIRHQLTVPDTPEENGIDERPNRTIQEKARAMMQEARLSEK